MYDAAADIIHIHDNVLNIGTFFFGDLLKIMEKGIFLTIPDYIQKPMIKKIKDQAGIFTDGGSFCIYFIDTKNLG